MRKPDFEIQAVSAQKWLEMRNEACVGRVRPNALKLRMEDK